MKKIFSVLAALFLTTSYSYAQAVEVAEEITVSDAKGNVEEKIDYEALYSKIPEIRAINKQIYEAIKAGKPVDELQAKKNEAIKRIESENKK